MLAVRRELAASYRQVLCASWQAAENFPSLAANGQSRGTCLASSSREAPACSLDTCEKLLVRRPSTQLVQQFGREETCGGSDVFKLVSNPYPLENCGWEQTNACRGRTGLGHRFQTSRPGGAVSVRLWSSAVDRETPAAEPEGQGEGEIEAREAARRARGVPMGRRLAVGDGPMGGDAAGGADCEDGATGAGNPPPPPPTKTLEQRVALLERQILPIGALKGDAFETKARLGGCAWLLDDLGLWASRTLAGNELLGSVRELYQAGALGADVRRVLQRIDLVVEGEHQETGDKVAVVVETSWQAARNDVERVRLFADVWQGVCGHLALPLVVCHEARSNVVAEARKAGVLVYQLGEFSANKGAWLVGPDW